MLHCRDLQVFQDNSSKPPGNQHICGADETREISMIWENTSAKRQKDVESLNIWTTNRQHQLNEIPDDLESWPPISAPFQMLADD